MSVQKIEERKKVLLAKHEIRVQKTRPILSLHFTSMDEQFLPHFHAKLLHFYPTSTYDYLLSTFSTRPARIYAIKSIQHHNGQRHLARKKPRF